MAATTISESPEMSQPAESVRVGTPKPTNPAKRGRPISTDEASLDPATAKQREIFRNRKRATLQRKSQRKAIEKEQETLAKTLAATSLDDRQTQDVVAEQISTRPWQPSADAAPLHPVPEDAPAPAAFEGARIAGFDGLPDLGEGSESEQLEPTNARSGSIAQSSTTSTPGSVQAARTRSKGKQKAVPNRGSSSTPSSTTGTLDRFLRKASFDPIPSDPADSIRSLFSPARNGFGSDLGDDGFGDSTGPNVDALDEQAQFDLAIKLSVEDQQRRQGVPAIDKEAEDDNPEEPLSRLGEPTGLNVDTLDEDTMIALATKASLVDARRLGILGADDGAEDTNQEDALLGAAILVQIAHSRKFWNRRVC